MPMKTTRVFRRKKLNTGRGPMLMATGVLEMYAKIWFGRMRLWRGSVPSFFHKDGTMKVPRLGIRGRWTVWRHAGATETLHCAKAARPMA